MKFSKKFEEDYDWYMSVADIFTFSGINEFRNRKGQEIVVYDPSGVDAKTAFYRYDSEGKIVTTKEPIGLRTLLSTKASVNLHIKMYAEDRARGYLPKLEFDKIVKQLAAPKWFESAVENQKLKYYEQTA